MSSLAELAELVGFFSYSRKDDEHSGKALSRLRARIHDELRLQLGCDVRLWQDTAAIPAGALWADEIKRAIAESVFFIPIVTPSAIASSHCKHEFDSFLKREQELGRQNLVFPILYIRVPGLKDERQRRDNELLRIIDARQYADWQKLRLRDLASADVAESIEQFCRNIVDALREPWETPQERQRREENEARQRAEKEERQQEQERARKNAAEAERQRLEREAEERARQAAAVAAERERRERDAALQREAEEKARQEERRKKASGPDRPGVLAPERQGGPRVHNESLKTPGEVQEEKRRKMEKDARNAWKFLACLFAAMLLIFIIALLDALSNPERGGWVNISIGIAMIVLSVFFVLFFSFLGFKKK